jgi:hypothetical protein
MKKILELCKQGGCFFSNKLKMACARNLKAFIIVFLIYCVFNYCTKFQTICFSLTIHFFIKNQSFACLIMPLPNLHMADMCKLGKGIN